MPTDYGGAEELRQGQRCTRVITKVGICIADQGQGAHCVDADPVRGGALRGWRIGRCCGNIQQTMLSNPGRRRARPSKTSPPPGPSSTGPKHFVFLISPRTREPDDFRRCLSSGEAKWIAGLGGMLPSMLMCVCVCVRARARVSLWWCIRTGHERAESEVGTLHCD